MNNIPIFNEEEEKLLKKYLEEYNDIYQYILTLPPNEFFINLSKRVEITLKDKLNGFSNSIINKVEEYCANILYPTDYKFAKFIKKNILKRNEDELSSHYFLSDILFHHCEKDKNNNYYVHTCGEKFQIYKLKKNSSDNVESSIYNNKFEENEKNDLFLYCIKCDMIYKSSFIKFKCFSTNEDFYSKAIDNTVLEELPFATWKHYHCNAIINDTMKCQKCNENLFYLKNKNKVFCKKCQIEMNPLDIKYRCLICKKEFSSEAKIYNPFEYKTIRICYKEAIINKVKAKPNKLYCGCKNEINTLKFIHKKNCQGELFLGELNNKKVIVCNKCDSLSLYDGYIWTCPNCYQKFKDKPNEEQKIKNNGLILKSNEKNYHNNEEDKNNLENTKTNLINFLKLKNETKETLNYIVNKRYNKNEYKIRKAGNSKEKRYQRCASGLELPSNLTKDLDSKKKINESSINKSKEKNVNEVITKNGLSSIKKLKKVPSINKVNNLNNELSPYNTNNKCLSKIVNKIPTSGKVNNSLIKSVKKIDKKEIEEVKNLEKLFIQESDRNDNKENSKKIINRNRNISDLPKLNNCSSSKDMSNSKMNELLYTEINMEKQLIKNVLKYRKNIINKANKILNNSSIRGRISCDNIITVNKSEIKKDNNSNIKQLFNKLNCSNSNIRGIPIIKQYINIKDIKKSSCSGSTSPDSDKRNNTNFSKIICGFDLNDYKIKMQIGKGSFGQIFLAEDKKNNKYALKKIIGSSSKEIKEIKKEYQILYDIQSFKNKVNIIKIHGLTSKKLDETTYVVYILMELAFSDWEKEIVKRKKVEYYYTEKEIFDILNDLVKSLAQLQRENISHRDIKPQNILLCEEKNEIKYKLADFGEAKELIEGDRPTNNQTLKGTELYMSPILFYGLRKRKVKKYIQHNPYKSDVFSLGLCFLLATTLCFESIYDVRELQNNVSIRIVIERYLKNRYSFDIVNIISKMLDINENTRMDFIELEKYMENFEK